MFILILCSRILKKEIFYRVLDNCWYMYNYSLGGCIRILGFIECIFFIIKFFF